MARPKKEGVVAAKSRIYVVELADGTKRLVKAVSKQQAIVHVSLTLIKSASSGASMTEAMIAAVQAGAAIEDATTVAETIDEGTQGSPGV